MVKTFKEDITGRKKVNKIWSVCDIQTSLCTGGPHLAGGRTFCSFSATETAHKRLHSEGTTEKHSQVPGTKTMEEGDLVQGVF